MSDVVLSYVFISYFHGYYLLSMLCIDLT